MAFIYIYRERERIPPKSVSGSPRHKLLPRQQLHLQDGDASSTNTDVQRQPEKESTLPTPFRHKGFSRRPQMKYRVTTRRST
eukprot:4818547-Amphidinium_carterae.1